MSVSSLLLSALICLNIQIFPLALTPERDLDSTSAGYGEDTYQEVTPSDPATPPQEEYQPVPPPEVENDVEEYIPPIYPPSPETPSPPEEDEYESDHANTPTPPIKNAPPGYSPEDESFGDSTIPDEEHHNWQSLLTDTEHLANIDYSLQMLLSIAIMLLAIAFVWFFVLKPLTWFMK